MRHQASYSKSDYNKKHNASEEYRTPSLRNHMPTVSLDLPHPPDLAYHVLWDWPYFCPDEDPSLPFPSASCLVGGFSKHLIFTKGIVGRYSTPILQKEKLRPKSQEFVLGYSLRSRARNLVLTLFLRLLYFIDSLAAGILVMSSEKTM